MFALTHEKLDGSLLVMAASPARARRRTWAERPATSQELVRRGVEAVICVGRRKLSVNRI